MKQAKKCDKEKRQSLFLLMISFHVKYPAFIHVLADYHNDIMMCNRRCLFTIRYIMSMLCSLIFVAFGFTFVNSQSTTTPPSFVHPTLDIFFHCADLKEDLDYNQCLRNRTPSWPFVRGSEDCRMPSTPNPNTPPACSPNSFKHEIVRRTLNNVNEEVVAYAMYSWKPCQAGITAITSFLLSVDRDDSICYDLQLKPNLTLDNSHRNVVFQFMDPIRLRQGGRYKVILRALPNPVDELPVEEDFSAPSCRELNSDYSCACANVHNDVRLRPLVVVVSGYSVTVTLIPAKPCFNVGFYNIIIDSPNPTNPKDADQVDNHGTTAVVGENITHTFRNVYDGHKQLEITVVPLRHQGSSGKIKPTVFHIEAWKPMKPNISHPTWSSAQISFIKPSDYDIKTFTIRLAKHDFIDGKISSNETVAVENVTATAEPNISYIFYGLSDGGVYSAQVREVRPGWNPKFYNPAYWGPPKIFHIEETEPLPISNDTTNLAILLPILVVALLTCVVVSCIVFLYCWKKGKCLPFREKLPAQLVEWLDTQTIHLTSKTILLVWQTDFRAGHLQEKHAEVINLLAAFLRRVCNLEVILDLYDETELSRGIADWVKQSFDRAEVVVFVCPHFNYMTEKIASLTGNFKRMYSYAERDLGDRSRYVTVLLPYSNLSSSSATEYLQKMTSVYNLMEQIEDLYFHIQGFSRFDCWGRHGAVNISDRDYRQTPGGRALYHAIRSFKAMDSNYSPSSSVTGSNDLDDSQEDAPSTSSGSRSYGEKDLLPDRDTTDIDSVEEEEDTVMVHSLSMVEGPQPSDPLLERARPPLEPIAPLVDNPEEELLRINQRPNEALIQEVEICPFHSRSDVILSTQSLASSIVDPHSSAYGQESRSFHIPELSVEEQEKDAAPPSVSPDSGFNSTRM